MGIASPPNALGQARWTADSGTHRIRNPASPAPIGSAFPHSCGRSSRGTVWDHGQEVWTSLIAVSWESKKLPPVPSGIQHLSNSASLKYMLP